MLLFPINVSFSLPLYLKSNEKMSLGEDKNKKKKATWERRMYQLRCLQLQITENPTVGLAKMLV